MEKLLLAISLGACALIGCSSLNSTFVGEAASGAKFEGMPIVLQRPKYLKVTYKKVTYQLLAKKTSAGTGGTTVEVIPLGKETTVDEITTEVVSVGEVFTLDLKRPAAGNTEYAVEFESNSQYPKKVGAKIEDKTAEVFGDLIQKGAQIFKPAAAPATDFPAEVRKVTEQTVKIELRSLDNPSKVYQVFP